MSRARTHSWLRGRMKDNKKEIKKKFDAICKPVPTWALSDEIGLDTETAYMLDVSTEENWQTAIHFFQLFCSEYCELEKKYKGKHVLMELASNGGKDNYWFLIHGDVEEYLSRARETLIKYLESHEIAY